MMEDFTSFLKTWSTLIQLTNKCVKLNKWVKPITSDVKSTQDWTGQLASKIIQIGLF